MDTVIFEIFMRRRFPRERDQLYIDEWRERFMSGHPEVWMDGKSLKIYKEVLREYPLVPDRVGNFILHGTVETGRF